MTKHLLRVVLALLVMAAPAWAVDDIVINAGTAGYAAKTTLRALELDGKKYQGVTINDGTEASRWLKVNADGSIDVNATIISGAGTAADIMKESMIRCGEIIDAEPTVDGKRPELVQTVHDELVFDLPIRPGWARLIPPLARAMTMQYSVTGSWDDPRIEPIEASGKEPAKQTPRPADSMPRRMPEFIEH